MACWHFQEVSLIRQTDDFVNKTCVNRAICMGCEVVPHFSNNRVKIRRARVISNAIFQIFKIGNFVNMFTKGNYWEFVLFSTTLCARYFCRLNWPIIHLEFLVKNVGFEV